MPRAEPFQDLYTNPTIQRQKSYRRLELYAIFYSFKEVSYIPSCRATFINVPNIVGFIPGAFAAVCNLTCAADKYMHQL